MNLLLLGLTLGTLGKIILGVAVLRVHIIIMKEHKIDSAVLKLMKTERIVTIFGLLLIVLGYFLEVYFYAGSTDLLTCVGGECAAAVSGALFK